MSSVSTQHSGHQVSSACAGREASLRRCVLAFATTPSSGLKWHSVATSRDMETTRQKIGDPLLCKEIGAHLVGQVQQVGRVPVAGVKRSAGGRFDELVQRTRLGAEVPGAAVELPALLPARGRTQAVLAAGGQQTRGPVQPCGGGGRGSSKTCPPRLKARGK